MHDNAEKAQLIHSEDGRFPCVSLLAKAECSVRDRFHLQKNGLPNSRDRARTSKTTLNSARYKGNQSCPTRSRIWLDP
jgi:hypothetical protein